MKETKAQKGTNFDSLRTDSIRTERPATLFELTSREPVGVDTSFESSLFEIPIYSSERACHKNQNSTDASRLTTSFVSKNPIFDDYIGSVDIYSFLKIDNLTSEWKITFKEPTIVGLVETELMPSTWKDKIVSNVLKQSQNVNDQISQLIQICTEKIREISSFFHASICNIEESGCSIKNCRNNKCVVAHVRSCKLKICNYPNCILYRKNLSHFCSCSKEECYYCRCLFHEVDNVIDTTNYDHSKFNIKPNSPQNYNDIFDYFFDCYLIFYELMMPSFEMVKGFSPEIRKLNPPEFFTDHILEPKSENSKTEPFKLIENFTYEDEKINIENTQNDISKFKADNGIKVSESNSENSITKSIFDFQESTIIGEKYNEVILNVKSVESSNIEDPKNISFKYQSLLNKLMNFPEAVYFNQPVDPVKLEIPDYFEIIHEPMDFSTVMQKLQNYEYISHWDVIYDMNLVFDNAYMYNKRVTRVHKCAVKLAQIFNSETAQIMSNLGYCCNKRMVYSPQILYCISSEFCIISIGAFYYRFDEKIIFCSKCFESSNSSVIEATIDDTEIKQISKSEFVKVRNNATVYEPFVKCDICQKKNHKVCVMHVDSVDGVLFYCNSCRINSNIPKNINHFSSNQLPVTILSDFIERRVNSFLSSECKDCQYVRIRMICNVDKILLVKTGLLNRFPVEFPEKFPYKSKALFAFQEVKECNEVCFFSMHVQEYGIDCPEPNNRRINLSYLDSVHYFRPKHLKTRLYHEILLSYLAYCKMMGFWFCHIWSCPPCEGFDYVFHCHSYEQKLPKPRRLLEWYIKMIELGVQNKIIIEYKDIYKYFEGYSKELATAIPYFEGDYWSNSLEDLIDEHEKEQLCNMDIPSGTTEIPHFLPAKKKASKQKKTNSKKSTSGEQTLNQKLLSVMDKYREVFFVIKLNEFESPFYVETDPIFQSDLMDGRSGFLSLCRENNWEFSSFRHAQYSTKAMMYVVHQQMFNFVEYTCDKCKAVLVTGYHCEECTSDYDLCLGCKSRNDHPHDLIFKTYIEFKLGLHAKTDATLSKNALREAGISREYYYNLFIKAAIHVTKCSRNQNCKYPICQAVRIILEHYNRCNRNDRSKCEICSVIFKIYSFHAKQCASSSCQLPTCSRIKHMLKPSRGAISKKIQSRISKMNNKLKEDKKLNSSDMAVNRPRKYHIQPDSDENNSNSTTKNNSLMNDPLFAIPPSNVPNNYSLGSLKPSSTASVGSVKQISTNERKNSSRATSRRSRKTETPQLLQYPEYIQYDNPCNLKSGFGQQPMIIMNQGARFQNQMDNIMSRNPHINYDPHRQMEIINPNQSVNVSLNDPTRQNFQTNISYQQSLNIAYPTSQSRNPTPTAMIGRSCPSNEMRQSSPIISQNISPITSIDQNKQIQNSGSRIGQSIGNLGNELVRFPNNFNSNINISSNVDMSSSSQSLQSNIRQNNPNYIIQALPMNQETGMVDTNSLSYFPNGTILVNSPQSSLNQLSFLTLQQAMQCQNFGVRPQNIIINGAEKQIIPNPSIRGNQVAGLNLMSYQSNNQNIQGNPNIILRPQLRPGMNINQINPGYMQIPQIQNFTNISNTRPPNINNSSFNIQQTVRVNRPSLPQSTHANPR